jgi:fatty acid/phospholipid synthesis protein PlsX
MASTYASAVYGVQNPRVGLLNNGTEDHKGLELHREVNELLKNTPCVNYVGNREGRELMYGDVDVMVSDGFTGNIAMKSVEGCGKAVSTIMKREFKRNPFTMLCALLSGKILKNIKKGLDYEGVGGAMFLGLTKAVVKGHGNSKARSFAVSIAQAASAARGNMTAKIKEMIDSVETDLCRAIEEEHFHNEQLIRSWRFRIVQLCELYLEQGFMTKSQFTQLSEMYSIYHSLGGNGQVTDYYEKAKALRIEHEEKK